MVETAYISRSGLIYNTITGRVFTKRGGRGSRRRAGKHTLLVIQRSVDDYNCFLLTDQATVEQPTREHAAQRIETELEQPF
jgi:hypothetical protein